MSGRVCVCVMLPPPTHRVDSRGRRYGDVTMQLHGVMGVVEEFRKYQSIPQIKQLIDRLQSLQYDLGQQIKVDFEKAFSIKGAPVSYIVTWLYSDTDLHGYHVTPSKEQRLISTMLVW